MVGLWGDYVLDLLWRESGLVLEESFLLLVHTEKENLGSRICPYSCFNFHGPNSQPEHHLPDVVG